MSRTADYDDTARLLVLDNITGVTEFVRAIRAEHPDMGISEAAALRMKYVGMDSGSRTHDAETGRRIA